MRGRLPLGQREERRQAILQAAIEELVAVGYDRVTMLGIARRAGASKETLYGWFGDKVGLYTEVVRHGADLTMARVVTALASPERALDTLRTFAGALLGMLCSEPSLSLNRAAMSAPDLAEVLLAEGRHRIGPVVEEFLAARTAAGELHVDDPAAGFVLLYGLVVADAQIRCLLGEPPPPDIPARAAAAVDRFLALTSGSRPERPDH